MVPTLDLVPTLGFLPGTMTFSINHSRPHPNSSAIEGNYVIGSLNGRLDIANKNRKEKMTGRKGFEISTIKKVVIKYGPYNMAHIT